MILHREAEEPWLLLFTKATTLCSLVLVMALLWLHQVSAGPVTVRFVEGVTHGFFVLHTVDRVPIATGDLLQVQRGGQIESRMVFRFTDGSLYDEAVVSLKSESLPCRVTTWYTADPRSPRTLRSRCSEPPENTA